MNKIKIELEINTEFSEEELFNRTRNYLMIALNDFEMKSENYNFKHKINLETEDEPKELPKVQQNNLR